MTEVAVRPDTVWALDFFEAPPCEAAAHNHEPRFHDGPAAYILIRSKCYRCGWTVKDTLVCRKWVYSVWDSGFFCRSGCGTANYSNDPKFDFQVAPL